MSEAADTQIFLNKAYTLVAEELRELMSKLLEVSESEIQTIRKLAVEIEIPTTDTVPVASEREEILNRIAWLPIAQECVVALLQAMFRRITPEPTYFYPKQLEESCQEINAHPEFSQSLGLNTADAKFALDTTAKVFLGDNLFTQPAELAVDHNTYTVHRADNHLVVQRTEERQSQY